jgi:hypothetical protein
LVVALILFHACHFKHVADIDVSQSANGVSNSNDILNSANNVPLNTASRLGLGISTSTHGRQKFGSPMRGPFRTGNSQGTIPNRPRTLG